MNECLFLLLSTVSNMAGREEEEEEEEEHEDDEERRESEESNEEEGRVSSASITPSAASLTETPSLQSKRHTKKRKVDPSSQLESALIAHLGSKREKTENQLFGEFVARSLDSLSPEQKFITCSKIHELLFHVKNGSNVAVQVLQPAVQVQSQLQPQYAPPAPTSSAQPQYAQPTGQYVGIDPTTGQQMYML